MFRRALDALFAGRIKQLEFDRSVLEGQVEKLRLMVDHYSTYIRAMNSDRDRKQLRIAELERELKKQTKSKGRVKR